MPLRRRSKVTFVNAVPLFVQARPDISHPPEEEPGLAGDVPVHFFVRHITDDVSDPMPQVYAKPSLRSSDRIVREFPNAVVIRRVTKGGKIRIKIVKGKRLISGVRWTIQPDKINPKTGLPRKRGGFLRTRFYTSDPRDYGHEGSFFKRSHLLEYSTYVTNKSFPGWDFSDQVSGVVRYQGHLVPNLPIVGTLPTVPLTPDGFLDIPEPITDIKLYEVGSICWNRSKPTAPSGALGQAVGEIREYPKVPSAQTLEQLRSFSFDMSKMRPMASVFLNTQFGWLPFLNDLRDLVQNTLNIQQHLAQLRRDNGSAVRRYYQTQAYDDKVEDPVEYLAADEALRYTDWPVPYSNDPRAIVVGPVERVRILHTRYDYRFAARFRYFINFDRLVEMDPKTWNALMGVLYGGDLTPALVWQLMPWSWLVDWFSNASEVISNIYADPFSNLVADYAYITGRYRRMETWQYKVRLVNRAEPYYFQASDILDWKRRVRATPYGFGISLSSLSPKQTAILLALGLTRARNN